VSSVKKTYFINKDGSMRCIRYDLTSMGDVLEKQWHQGPDTHHTTIMIWGKVKAIVTREEPLILEADANALPEPIADICDWPAGSEYAFEVLRAPVRFVNIWGPNISLQRYQRMCPECRAIKFKMPPSNLFFEPSAAILPPSSTLKLDDIK